MVADNSKKQLAIFWFRRDLRTRDNAGLSHALRSGYSVLPVFIFDRQILDKLEDKDDRRINFIHQQLQKLQAEFRQADSELWVHHGNPSDVFRQLALEFKIAAIYTNTDYEPYARKRDREIQQWAQKSGIEFNSYKDQVIFEKDEVLKPDGKPYTVFTPYSHRWNSNLSDIQVFDSQNLLKNCYQPTKKQAIPTLSQIGFKQISYEFPKSDFPSEIIANYHETRDFPAQQGTSLLGVHLRFGTISIRELVQFAIENNKTYLNELIWREFYMMILYHFPEVENQAFKPAYRDMPWLNNETHFERWQQGTTGYPIVDAGMRQLQQTGYMHNRIRMVTASFLTKHLLVDWRWGEAHFSRYLLDFELAANNGGWQWAAGTGCDAAPYFRVFNPDLQTKKFDANLRYIKQWVPELENSSYPAPIVHHAEARNRALAFYKKHLKN